MTETHGFDAPKAGPATAPAALLRGYDNISGGMLDKSAITGTPAYDGGTSTVNIEVCESVSDLAKSLEIDASLSFSYLKAANVTAKMKFVQELNLTQRSVTIVVYSSHVSGVWSVGDVALKAKAPANEDAAATFVGEYGDSYVSEATVGGEYYAVYVFNTETREDQQSLATSLKGKITGGGATVKADAQVNLSNFLKTSKTSWSLKQKITGHANPKLPDQDKLIEYALEFPSIPLSAPIVIDVKVKGYERVLGEAKKTFNKIVKNRRYFLGTDGVMASFARLTGLKNQVRWLKKIYARYGYKGDTGLNAFEKQVDSDLAKINEQIADYDLDPGDTFTKPELPSLEKGEPVFSFKAEQPLSFGGEEGGEFKFMPVGEAFRNRVKIASLQMADGLGVIRRLEVEYASDKTNWKAVHGQGGTAREKVDLEEGQFPVKFRINSGLYVDRMEIHLSDGRTTWAGGTGGRLAPDVDVKLPTVALGFAGRCGEKLDQLKIIRGTLQPAEFVEPVR